MKATLLNDQEIKSLQEKIPKWNLADKKISRQLQFSNFIDAFAFMTKVAIIAEGMGHHPDWSNVYAKVTIELSTHEVGGLSNLDFELASNIDKLIND
tara:strand:- start:485 stop:775 length:291 start_codon:yes stop_codon:yes gene_type:complete